MDNRVNINERYIKEGEIRLNSLPYEDYCNCIDNVFDLKKINSFCDVGCANGPLLYQIKKNNENIKVFGIEYFPWHKEAADILIKEQILTHDLRDELPNSVCEKYEIVNCTETGEHIDPEFVSVFINNLKRVCGKYLIISWSDCGGVNDREHDEHLQHLNPLKKEEVEELLENNGFIKNNELTNKFVDSSYNKSNFNFWWRKSLSIWELKE